MIDPLKLFPIPPLTKGHRISAAARRNWDNPEYREKQIQASRRSHTPEQMEKMRLAAQSDEAKAKRAASLKLSWRDPRRRDAQRKNRWSPEQRAAHSKKITEWHRRRKKA